MSLHLRADTQDRYNRFLARVIETREVWVLVSPNEKGAWCPSSEFENDAAEPTTVHLFFSAAAYARQHAKEQWATYSPKALSLEFFLDGVLRRLSEARELAGCDFNADLAGLEVEPAELAADLIKRLEG